MMPGIVLTVLAVFYVFAALFFLGARKPAYSHLRHTISELGEIGAPQARVVAMGVFLPIGIVMLLVAWLVRAFEVETFALALCLAAGYLAAALFPCDAGAPVSGTWRQAAHNLGGAIEYIGGAFALMGIAAHAGDPFRTLGIVVLGAAIAMLLPPLASVRGMVQRVAELCLFGGLALAISRSG